MLKTLDLHQSLLHFKEALDMLEAAEIKIQEPSLLHSCLQEVESVGTDLLVFRSRIRVLTVFIEYVVGFMKYNYHSLLNLQPIGTSPAAWFKQLGFTVYKIREAERDHRHKINCA